MPIYQYTCGRCGLKVDIIRRLAERDLKSECACGGVCLRDLFPGGHVASLVGQSASNVNELRSGPTGVTIEGPGGITMVDCGFSGLERGIVAGPDVALSLTRTKFQNVKVPIERKRR
jgi:putative FmdB family regulatory protein